MGDSITGHGSVRVSPPREVHDGRSTSLIGYLMSQMPQNIEIAFFEWTH